MNKISKKNTVGNKYFDKLNKLFKKILKSSDREVFALQFLRVVRC